LRHRNFQLFFSGQLISLIGTWMQTVAQSWLVYKMTGIRAAAGFGRVCQPDPGVPDRAHRRHHRRPHQPQKVVIATQTASMLLALMLAALTLSHRVHVWHIFVLASLLGVVNAFDIPDGNRFWSTWWEKKI
jgi:hypothetical protein